MVRYKRRLSGGKDYEVYSIEVEKSPLFEFSQNKFDKNLLVTVVQQILSYRGGIVFFNSTWHSFNPLTKFLTVQEKKHLEETLKSIGFFSSYLPGKGVTVGLISNVTVEVTCVCKRRNMHGNQLQVPWATEYSGGGIINVIRSELIIALVKMEGGIWHQVELFCFNAIFIMLMGRILYNLHCLLEKEKLCWFQW